MACCLPMKVLSAFLFTLALAFCAHAAPIKVLLIDGQNNHAWATTSPEIKKILEEPGIFNVDVATSPADINAFAPKFADYQHAFVMTTRAADHPIMAGLPATWMHAQDELYDSLRGPAKNVTVIASAMSSPAKGGSGEDEPLLMTIGYGKGRIFHTALGHGMEGLKCQGFATTLQRGVEWAATGNVTQNAPANFPTEVAVVSRP